MKILSIVFVLVFLMSCSENSTDPNNSGIINGYVTVGHNNLTPKQEIKLYLEKRINDSSYDSISFVIPNKNGFYEFVNLEPALYNIRIKANEHYTGSLDGLDEGQLFDLKNNITQSGDFNLYGWYHFSRDTFEISVDTSNGNWMSASINSVFFNDGIRDTLIWSIDSTAVPLWLSVNPNQDIFPPAHVHLTNSLLSFGILKHTFPVEYFNKNVPIAINHNYGIDSIYVKFSAYN